MLRSWPLISSTMTGLWHRMTLVLVLLCVCLWGTTDGGVAVESVRPKRKPKKPAPTPIAIELNPDVPPVDMTKVRTLST